MELSCCDQPDEVLLLDYVTPVFVIGLKLAHTIRFSLRFFFVYGKNKSARVCWTLHH